MISSLFRLVPSGIKNKIKQRMYAIGKNPNSTEYYAQFGEDAIIQTYFKNISWDKYGTTQIIDKGFYVDIGAYDPVALSSTYWFYKNGWQGITVDPTPGVKEKFDRIRPRDINVQAAIADTEGFVDFYSWGHSVFNTLSADAMLKSQADNKTSAPPLVTKTEVFRLSTLLDKYLPAGQPISFMNIDVEGKDLEVLMSNNWEKYRPELIIVEEHIYKLEELMDSQIVRFLKSKDYELMHWVQPGLIFRRLTI